MIERQFLISGNKQPLDLVEPQYTNHENEFQGIEEYLKDKIHLYSLKVTLNKVSNRKPSGHDGIIEFRLKRFISIHEILAL